MPTLKGLNSGDYLFCRRFLSTSTTPFPLPSYPHSMNTIGPSPQLLTWSCLRTLDKALREVQTVKICFFDKIVF